ncbi:MAG: DUF4132 domain-containing protein [Eubacteriales bacterium]|nr:DUF4132 domain-containing protein [Eubacteriales bacterium]
MNLGEERDYLKLQEALEALELTEGNRALAERYLDPAQPENPKALEKAEHQDFSDMTNEQRRVTHAYVEHCEKRNKKEELGRWVRLICAIGGSVAFYPLAQYGFEVRKLGVSVSEEQNLAMEAEAHVWSSHSLDPRSLNLLWEAGRKNPEILYRASGLCYGRSANAKLLLKSMYLSLVKPSGNIGSILKNILGKKDADTEKIAWSILMTMNNSLQSLFVSSPTEEELRELRRFLDTDHQTGPIPEPAAGILKKYRTDDYLLKLFAGCAFLSMAHWVKLQSFLRMCLAANRWGTLNACQNAVMPKQYEEREVMLERLLPISQQSYLEWCIKTKLTRPIRRMAQQNPEVIYRAAESCTLEEYTFLMQSIQAVPTLYREMSASFGQTMLEKSASQIVESFTVGQTEAKAYLLGEGELTSLYPFADRWKQEKDYYLGGFHTLEQLPRDGQLFRRGLILAALRQFGYLFSAFLLRSQGDNRFTGTELLEIFRQEQLPFSFQLECCESIYGSFYGEKDKEKFLDEAVKHYAKYRSTYGDELRLGAGNAGVAGRCICIRALDAFWQQEKETLLACAQDSSKMVKGLLEAVYGSHREWEPEVLALLSSKKSQERELAVLVLRQWGTDRYRKQLEEALEKEKSKKLQELIRGSLGMADQAADGTGGHVRTPKELATEILKGGKKRKIAWVLETPGTAVPLKDGSEAPEEYLQAILVAYADMPVPGFSPDAKTLAGELAADRLADFMAELFGKWLENKAEAKKKWVLYAASIHGGGQIIPLIHHQIQEWPQYARGAMAAEAVKALALNGSSEALLLVDNISRKFKFRQVKTAAGEALSYAAEQMNISREELEDRIVPGLGFGEDMSRTFDYGTRTFTVYLTPDLELEVLDKDQKRLKTLPAPGKRDEEEKAAAAYGEFKQLKKQLKTVVTNQKLRLEQALTAERQWKSDQWTALFVKNPVMHQFAIGLIWGVYEQGTLKDTFRYMEDGSFNTVDEEEYELPTEGMIGLVHPVELDAETIGAWKEQLSDYEVTQPIPQLERQVFDITEEERQETELTRFGGKILNDLSLTGKLQTMGWYRGSVQDGGVYTTFYREDGEIGVELEFSGTFVGGENDDVTVYGATFYKAGTVKRGSYVYDTIKPENRYRLGEVNARYFSEIVYQLTKATASSQEQVAYPECRK